MSTDVHTLSGAYALDALSPEEAEEFRRHLDHCQACRDEVRELQWAAARMGAAETTTPPAQLKARILAAADRTPQEPPMGAPAKPVSEPGAEPGRRWLTWLAAAAAAVVIVGGGAFGVQAMLDDDEPVLAAEAVQVFSAEDARTATAETVNGGKVKVGVSASRNEMAVDTSGLPELDDEHVYQIWSVQGEEMVSVKVLSDPDEGAAMGMPAEDTEVALTIEPVPGSEQPTGDPIVQVDPYAVLEG